MKIGYPCINNQINCTTNTTFRLANYSEENLIKKVSNNLNCLQEILKFNVKNELMFFRLSSAIIPFASYPICKFNWQNHFKDQFQEIGNFIKKNEIRISMHPDQFTLINAQKKDIVERSIAELKYHCEFLNLLELDESMKVQIHVGGVYGEKKEAMQRFVLNYKKLPEFIRQRLAVENDDKSYSLRDCLEISNQVDIPIIFDSLHHECLNNGESFFEAVKLASQTWQKKEGVLMTDYSSQAPNERKGKHIENINLAIFKKYIQETKDLDFDIMLEIKNKEKSALQALKIVKQIRKN